MQGTPIPTQPSLRRPGKGKRAEGHQGHKQHMAAKFILMDPSKSPGQSLLSELPEMEIFPNPSENANTVTFFLEASDDVRLELLSKEGQVLRTIFQGKMEAGAHSLPVETSGLGTNLYYYKITTSEGSSTKRFTVAR